MNFKLLLPELGILRVLRARRFGFLRAVPDSPVASPALPWVNPLAARIHPAVFAMFLIGVAADSIRRWLGLAWPSGWEALSPGIWAMAALTLVIGLARRLPSQNVLAIAVLASGLGFAIEALNARADLPFGRRVLTPLAEPTGAGVAWFQPCFWLALAISGRGIARLILRPWRKLNLYGIWVMMAATGLSLVIVLEAEPFATWSGWWWRENRPGVLDWYGTPLAAGMGWVLTTLLIYGFTTPWFLNKQPVKQPTDWHPLLVWIALLLWLSIGGILAGAWMGLALAVLAASIAITLAIRGGTW